MHQRSRFIFRAGIISSSFTSRFVFRLFALFVKMLKTAGDLNAMLVSLIEMLQGVLSPLFDRRSGNAQLDFEMLDWLLLVLNEVFQNSGMFVCLTALTVPNRELYFSYIHII